jgi:phosphatidylglycerophosphate synthase
MPSIAELRAVTQPASLLARPGAEHWAGRLYMRRLSPYFTRLLVSTPLSANAVTALMLVTGLLTALALSFPGVLTAVAAVLLAQLQLLLDCADGEVARWRGRFSPAGEYIDHLAHSVTQAALPAALGVRADGGWDSIGGWTATGLAVGVLLLLLKLETYLVEVVLGRLGRPAREEPAQPARRFQLRHGWRLVPFLRPFHWVEATLLAFGAAVVDALAGELVGSRVLLVGLLAAAIVAVIGNAASILASKRLR